MKFVNDFNNQKETFENRLIISIRNNNEIEIIKMMIECQNLYVNGELTKDEFNFYTDIELLKQIF